MEVEARMKRNYLPPSIQSGQYQTQGTCQGCPQATQHTQDPKNSNQPCTSYSQNNPSIPSSRDTQKPTKMTLETIPQGSIMGTQSYSSQSAAISPFTPSIGPFSPTHGSVVNQIPGSITSGTPILGSQNSSTGHVQNVQAPSYGTQGFGSITSGTPMTQNFPPTHSYQGSITSGTPNSYPSQSTQCSFSQSSQSFQGSITYGTPVLGQMPYLGTQNIQVSAPSYPGSITSGIPVQSGPGLSTQSGFGQSPSNYQGSITSGTPMTQQSPQYPNLDTQNIPGSTYQGSITSGTPVLSAVQYQTAQISPMCITSAAPVQTTQCGYPGSITSGTPAGQCQQYPILGTQSGPMYPNAQYSQRPQRKHSGPQRLKLQMLATVQEMGKFC